MCERTPGRDSLRRVTDVALNSAAYEVSATVVSSPAAFAPGVAIRVP
jgi:hypothetical protein